MLVLSNCSSPHKSGSSGQIYLISQDRPKIFGRDNLCLQLICTSQNANYCVFLYARCFIYRLFFSTILQNLLQVNYSSNTVFLIQEFLLKVEEEMYYCCTFIASLYKINMCIFPTYYNSRSHTDITNYRIFRSIRRT